MNIKALKKQWWWYGSVGALFFGSGLSLVSEAGHWKHQEVIWYQWAGFGVLGLALALSGVVFLINAGILKERMRVLSTNE